MSKPRRDGWTDELLNDDELLYRRYTTAYYLNGRPHPLKAPDEIRRRMKRTADPFLKKMGRALNYAERIKTEWIKNLKSEEKYLRSKGWRTEPFQHEEFMGDHDTWISPKEYKRSGLFGPYISKKGAEMSRMGAIDAQCSEDGHLKPKNSKGPFGMPLICCSRCGSAFGIG